MLSFHNFLERMWEFRMGLHTEDIDCRKVKSKEEEQWNEGLVVGSKIKKKELRIFWNIDYKYY